MNFLSLGLCLYSDFMRSLMWLSFQMFHVTLTGNGLLYSESSIGLWLMYNEWRIIVLEKIMLIF